MSKISGVLDDIILGRPIVVVDDYDRENEGDVVIAAEKADQFNLSFAMKHARGLMCVPCLQDRLDRLKIPMMYSNGLDDLGTPFACSIDAIHGTTTGMSVFDRMKTISGFLDENSKPEDFCTPGHLFPLRAKPRLLEERQGHTESSVQLMLLANLKPVAVIVEIMNDNGTMANGEDLVRFCKEYGLKMISVKEIADEANRRKGL